MSFEENITTLKRRRATIQASCTRIKTFVESVVSAPVTSSITAQLEERRAKFDHYWSEYESVQTKIEFQDENESSRGFRGSVLRINRTNSRIIESCKSASPRACIHAYNLKDI